MSNPRQKVRYAFQFWGRVQGVGFRYHASHAADFYSVTGWVRNEYDGSVTMEAQGTKEDIADMVRMLEDDRWIQIEDRTLKELPLEEEERSFRVRY